MNLREQILTEHTKQNRDKIVTWIGNDQKRFNQLFRLFLNGEYRVTQRAAWPLSYIGIAHPELLKKHFDELVSNLEKPGLHDAVKRNTLRLLEQIEIPDKFEGPLMQICFRFIESPNEAVAIKVFSLGILDKLSKKYPEIVPEIKLLIEDQIADQTAGFKSRAKKFLERRKLE